MRAEVARFQWSLCPLEVHLSRVDVPLNNETRLVRKHSWQREMRPYLWPCAAAPDVLPRHLNPASSSSFPSPFTLDLQLGCQPGSSQRPRRPFVRQVCALPEGSVCLFFFCGTIVSVSNQNKRGKRLINIKNCGKNNNQKVFDSESFFRRHILFLPNVSATRSCYTQTINPAARRR